MVRFCHSTVQFCHATVRLRYGYAHTRDRNCTQYGRKLTEIFSVFATDQLTDPCVVFLKLQEKMSYHKSFRWTNKEYYKLLLQLESNKHLLNESQKRLLERYLRMCRINGSNLNDKDAKICLEIMNKIAKEQTTFK